jgi:hypothetical protein
MTSRVMTSSAFMADLQMIEGHDTTQDRRRY